MLYVWGCVLANVGVYHVFIIGVSSLFHLAHYLFIHRLYGGVLYLSLFIIMVYMGLMFKMVIHYILSSFLSHMECDASGLLLEGENLVFW